MEDQEESALGYQQTLMYGRYSRTLGDQIRLVGSMQNTTVVFFWGGGKRKIQMKGEKRECEWRKGENFFKNGLKFPKIAYYPHIFAGE